MQEAIEQWGDDDDIPEQFGPIVERSVGGDDRGVLFVAAHDDIRQFVAGALW